jgi:hypothetical protein
LAVIAGFGCVLSAGWFLGPHAAASTDSSKKGATAGAGEMESVRMRGISLFRGHVVTRGQNRKKRTLPSVLEKLASSKARSIVNKCGLLLRRPFAVVEGAPVPCR